MLTEWETIAAWDWVTVGRGWAVLHHVASLDDPRATQDNWNGMGVTSCGKRGNLWIPGILTRMSAKRCGRCCKATGMPRGQGSPKNDDACRPLVERALAAAGRRGRLTDG